MNSPSFSVLDVLVDKLLEDTDALLRKGFTLNDVLDNLSEKGKQSFCQPDSTNRIWLTGSIPRI